jgi:hypothetical protein
VFRRYGQGVESRLRLTYGTRGSGNTSGS